MQTTLIVICFVLAYICAALSAIKNLHIFQLNSYKPKVQIKWMLKNKILFTSHIASVLLAVLSVFPSSFKVIISVLFFAALLLLHRPQKAKKPLVYTPRVKRLAATCAIIYALLALCAFFAADEYRVSIAYLSYFVSSFAVLLANFINSPIEKAIRNYYINDAKKLLKSADNLTIIGITGSYGKTSFKFFLNAVLRAKYNVLMTPESFNTPMGVVKTIREQLRPTHEFFICEMGARNVGDIKEICDIVHPKFGVITSVGEQHLESFKTVENIVKTKFELAESLPENSVVFLNGDNELIRGNMQNYNHITYGLSQDCDYYAFDINVSPKGTDFKVKMKSGEIYDFHTNLIGEHNVTNIVGTVAVGEFFGINPRDIAAEVRKLIPVLHRMQLIERENITIIDDAYNSNPNGCRAALKTLAMFENCRKIVVTPGMVELGDKQYQCNFEFGKDIAKYCDYAVLVGEKQTKPIFEGITAENFDTAKIFVVDSINEAFNKVNNIKTDCKKIVLIENDLPDNY